VATRGNDRRGADAVRHSRRTSIERALVIAEHVERVLTFTQRLVVDQTRVSGSLAEGSVKNGGGA
jgi:hypothetical protein